MLQVGSTRSWPRQHPRISPRAERTGPRTARRRRLGPVDAALAACLLIISRSGSIALDGYSSPLRRIRVSRVTRRGADPDGLSDHAARTRVRRRRRRIRGSARGRSSQSRTSFRSSRGRPGRESKRHRCGQLVLRWMWWLLVGHRSRTCSSPDSYGRGSGGRFARAPHRAGARKGAPTACR